MQNPMLMLEEAHVVTVHHQHLLEEVSIISTTKLIFAVVVLAPDCIPVILTLHGC